MEPIEQADDGDNSITTYLGHRLPIPGSRPKTFAEGRICRSPSCSTQLSRYNKLDTCWLHAEFRVPRIRGNPLH